MPTSLVKTPRDERLWQKAKDIADEAGHAGNYAYVMGVYKKMNPDRFDKSAAWWPYVDPKVHAAINRRLDAALEHVDRAAVALRAMRRSSSPPTDVDLRNVVEELGQASAIVDHANMAASRVASRYIQAYTPGHRSDKGYTPGFVQQHPPYRGTGSQTPEPRDRDGNVIDVPQYGMMRIPGYEWHDKSKKFHSGT